MNVVLSKQVKNTVAVWHFSIKKKDQLPAIRITEQPIPLKKRKIEMDSIQSSSNTCKNFSQKIYSQHGNFLNAI